MESSWWQRLEQELEQQFDRFLNDHPNQKELLHQENWNDEQRTKHKRLQVIEQEAQHLRHDLLELFKEINAWTKRVERARNASATELAIRAETHINDLMEEGRRKWKLLVALGKEAKATMQELTKANNQSHSNADMSELDKLWENFETEQELQNLQNKQ